MIYVLFELGESYECSNIQSVWEVDVNVQDAKREFFLNAAKQRNIVINPHWFNIMNHSDHNSHLTKIEYSKVAKEWKKFLSFWNTRKFLVDILKAKEVEFEILY